MFDLIADVNKLRLSFDELKASFVRRCGNSVAHLVVKNAMRENGVRTWEFYSPWLASSILEDERPF